MFSLHELKQLFKQIELNYIEPFKSVVKSFDFLAVFEFQKLLLVLCLLNPFVTIPLHVTV